MAEALIITTDRDDLPVAVGQLLLDAGYTLRWQHESECGAKSPSGPESLVVFEMKRLQELRALCNGLVVECHQRHVPCLVFSAAGLLEADKVFEPTHGVIHDRDNLIEWSEKLAVFQQLAWQARELKQMQGRLLERSAEEEDDLRSAAMIQRSLLPIRVPEIGKMNFAWEFTPFEKVGGDLFNVLQVDEENMIAFLLDVSGHGISSAMVTVSVNQSLSTHTSQVIKKVFSKPPYYRLLSPAEVMVELANEYPFDRFDKFFTIVYMLINIKTGQLTYSCAGHPPPLLLRKDGEIEWLSTGGGLIGLLDTGPYEEDRLTLEPGDRLFLYSDGLIEYCNYNGESFGSERLVELLNRGDMSLKETCGNIRKALDHFGNHRPLQDDVSLLAMEYYPGDA